MADFDLSMVIRGDGSSAAAAADQVETGLEGVATAQARVTRTSRDMQGASAGAASAERDVGQAAQEAAASTNNLGQAQEELAREFNDARQAATAAASGTTAAARAQRDATRAANDNAAALNRAAFGARNAGQQVGDFGLSIASGISPARAFAQQAGQMGYALSEMGGAAGKVGAFLTGPWGIALTIGLAVLAPFIEKLFDGDKAADELAASLDKAATAADSFGAAQSLVGKIIDLTTGKLKTQNKVLIETIRLQAEAALLAGQKAEKKARDEISGIVPETYGATSVAMAGGFGQRSESMSSVRAQLEQIRRNDQTTAPLRGLIDDLLAGRAGNASDIRRRVDALGKSGSLLGRSEEDTIKLKQTLYALPQAQNDQQAARDALRAIDSGGRDIAPELRPYARDPKPKKPKKPREDTTTPREAEEIQRINEEFDRTPTLVDKAAQATRRLDKIIADLAKRKPPGFEKLIADANAAKGTIQEGLQRPYQDFIRDQQQALDVQHLLTEGRVDEANALKTVQSLQATMGPLTDDQKDAILASVQALRMEQRELDILRQKNAKYVEAIGGIKTVVEDATQAFVRGDLGQLLKSPGKILDVFQTFSGRELFDKVFGDTFRDLEDQANGTSVVRDASDRMAKAVDKASTSIARLGNAADQAAGSVAGAGAAGAAGAAGGTATNAEGDVVVTGRRNPIVSSIGKLGEKLGGLVGLKDPKAFGATIGKFAGKGLEGAATGSVVAGVSKALGIKMSGTGAQIGGAIGNFLPIPGGSIIGSIAGGLLGGLFSKTKTGSATISNVGGEAGISGVGGNSGSYKKAASGLAGSVIDSLNSVVDALGGELGDFAVSIGQRKKKYVVDTTGRGKTKGGGTQSYDTAEEAAAAALVNAIADGAVKGISPAMQRALQNADVEKGVKEALKVKEVEALIGGLGSALKAQFDSFDTMANDRVNTARKYGLDILAVEKINGEARAKLVDDTLKSRIGSLSDFLDQLKFGDLAEGTAADKRNALLDKIKTVQADAEAGKDGAADQLAGLYSQLVSTSRDAFGTAGAEYGTDRNNAQSAVERVIQMETDRVNQAAGITQAAQATTTAVEAGNALTSETNDLLAQVATEVRNLSPLLAAKLGYGGGGDYGIDYGITGRFANLQIQ